MGLQKFIQGTQEVGSGQQVAHSTLDFLRSHPFKLIQIFFIKGQTIRNYFFKITFPPKNEQTNLTLLLWAMMKKIFILIHNILLCTLKMNKHDVDDSSGILFLMLLHGWIRLSPIVNPLYLTSYTFIIQYVYKLDVIPWSSETALNSGPRVGGFILVYPKVYILPVSPIWFVYIT